MPPSPAGRDGGAAAGVGAAGVGAGGAPAPAPGRAGKEGPVPGLAGREGPPLAGGVGRAGREAPKPAAAGRAGRDGAAAPVLGGAAGVLAADWLVGCGAGAASLAVLRGAPPSAAPPSPRGGRAPRPPAGRAGRLGADDELALAAGSSLLAAGGALDALPVAAVVPRVGKEPARPRGGKLGRPPGRAGSPGKPVGTRCAIPAVTSQTPAYFRVCIRTCLSASDCLYGLCKGRSDWVRIEGTHPVLSALCVVSCSPPRQCHAPASRAQHPTVDQGPGRASKGGLAKKCVLTASGTHLVMVRGILWRLPARAMSRTMQVSSCQSASHRGQGRTVRTVSENPTDPP